MKKRSPRAPSLSLDEAIERTKKIYAKEKRHPAPPDAAAQHLGYKNATNGAAATVIATLRYYGLIERPDGKMIAVTKDIESYMFAPSDHIKHEILTNWLKTPPIFAELLEQYENQLPSDENLKFNLIQRGFLPEAADACLNVFKRSVEFTGYYDSDAKDEELNSEGNSEPEKRAQPPVTVSAQGDSIDESSEKKQTSRPEMSVNHLSAALSAGVDRIPVRLAKGRRAWVEIPSPFYDTDKTRLIAQIELLLTDDEEEMGMDK